MRILAMIVLLISFFACDEEISGITLEDRTAVIDGFIYANRPIDSIRITESISYSEEQDLITLDDLQVIISNDEESFVLESIGAGYYRKLEHIVREDMEYKMSFQFEGEDISAITYVNSMKEVAISETRIEIEKVESFGSGAATDIVEVELSWINPELDYYFVDVENIESTPEYVNDRFELIIEQGIELPASFFQSDPGIIDFFSINSRRELQIYGTYIITVYRLNPEYAALYETTGNSTLSLQEPQSNVTNGLGIFTGVTPHVLQLEVVKK